MDRQEEVVELSAAPSSKQMLQNRHSLIEHRIHVGDTAGASKRNRTQTVVSSNNAKGASHHPPTISALG